jgi:methionine synthase II (cobalamin-independent)
VVAATRALERRRVPAEAVETAYRDDLHDFLRLQKEAGLSHYSDGLLRWHDIFRPVAAGAGLRTEMLVRWFDNNAFFRAPEIDRDVPYLKNTAEVVPDRSVPKPRVETLASPFMFSRAAHTSADRNQLMLEISKKLLRPAADAAIQVGAEIIHLQEPWLAYYGIEASDWSPFEKALAQLKEGLKASLVLHVYFGDARPHLDRLISLPIDVLGIDLVETDVNALKAFAGGRVGLLAGCLNARRSIVESLQGTLDLVRRVQSIAEPKVLYLSTNADLELLPTEVAASKVRRLGEVAAQLQVGAAV